MNVVVSYNNNEVKMSYIITKLVQEYTAVLFPLKGNMIICEGRIRWVGAPIELLLIPCSNENSILFTSNPIYKDYSGKVFDYELSRRDNISTQLVELCHNKFITSGNKFSLELSGPATHITVSPSEGGSLVYTVHSNNGDVVMESIGLRRDLLAQCDNILSFSYRTETPACVKEVCVGKSLVEILREVAHYLSKIIYFTEITDGKVNRRIAMSSNGIVEITSNRGNQRDLFAKKVQPAKVKIPYNASIFALDASIDSVLKARNVFSFLGVG